MLKDLTLEMEQIEQIISQNEDKVRTDIDLVENTEAENAAYTMHQNANTLQLELEEMKSLLNENKGLDVKELEKTAVSAITKEIEESGSSIDELYIKYLDKIELFKSQADKDSVGNKHIYNQEELNKLVLDALNKGDTDIDLVKVLGVANEQGAQDGQIDLEGLDFQKGMAEWKDKIESLKKID